MGAKAKNDYMPSLRRAFWDGLMRECRRRGKLPGEIMQELFQEDPVKMLELMMKAQPRETNISAQIKHQHRHTHVGVSETTTFINETLGIEEDGAPTKPLPN